MVMLDVSCSDDQFGQSKWTVTTTLEGFKERMLCIILILWHGGGGIVCTGERLMSGLLN